MKKLGLLLICIFLMCGCGNVQKENKLNDFKNKINDIKSYMINGTMEISNDEESFKYSIESYYLKDNYYKVVLVNQNNNHEQVILKTNEEIYVITPALNKSFKFQSEWPNNSSQAYLLDMLINDVRNDNGASIEETNDGYIIKSKVNYPNNEELKYEKIYLNNDLIPKKIEVYNENDLVKIKVEYSNVNLNKKLSKDDFKIDDYIKEDEQVPCEGEGCEQKTASIDNIIYPLYIPSNTYLTSSETVDTGNGNRVILTFSGEKNFVLIEEVSKIEDELSIIPVYGEPLMLDETIGAVSQNSLSFDVGNISYYLASTELSIKEMKSIANSLGNTRIVAAVK